jgi:hypothetical protein
MAAPNPQTIADALANAIAANEGALSVTVDGVTMTFADPLTLAQAYEFWAKKAAVASGRRPRLATINLGGPQ